MREQLADLAAVGRAVLTGADPRAALLDRWRRRENA
jgi:hypothetical protein